MPYLHSHAEPALRCRTLPRRAMLKMNRNVHVVRGARLAGGQRGAVASLVAIRRRSPASHARPGQCAALSEVRIMARNSEIIRSP
jgi:hypothetical protein